MINGYDVLKSKYPDFDNDARTPNGLDLRLGNVYKIEGKYLKLYDDVKEIGKLIKVKPFLEEINHRSVYKIYPKQAYIFETDRQIKIAEDCMQLYRPRSSLLRCGVALHTAVGDVGYNGRLQFLCYNYTDNIFYIEQGARFAQLIDIPVKGASISYDGDYQEEEE